MSKVIYMRGLEMVNTENILEKIYKKYNSFLFDDDGNIISNSIDYTTKAWLEFPNNTGVDEIPDCPYYNNLSDADKSTVYVEFRDSAGDYELALGNSFGNLEYEYGEHIPKNYILHFKSESEREVFLCDTFNLYSKSELQQRLFVLPNEEPVLDWFKSLGIKESFLTETFIDNFCEIINDIDNDHYFAFLRPTEFNDTPVLVCRSEDDELYDVYPVETLKFYLSMALENINEREWKNALLTAALIINTENGSSIDFSKLTKDDITFLADLIDKNALYSESGKVYADFNSYDVERIKSRSKELGLDITDKKHDINDYAPLSWNDDKDIKKFQDWLNRNINSDKEVFNSDDALFILKYGANIDDKPDQLTIIDDDLYFHNGTEEIYNNPQRDYPDTWDLYGKGKETVYEIIGRTTDLTADYPLSENQQKIHDKLVGFYNSQYVQTITFNGKEYKTKEVYYNNRHIPLAEEELNRDITEILENEPDTSELYKQAYSLDENYTAYIPEDILTSYSSHDIVQWCVDNGIEVIPAEEYSPENKNTMLFSDFLSSLGGFPNDIDYEILNDKIHILPDKYDDWLTSHGLTFRLFDSAEDVIEALPDSIFESIYDDVDENYSQKYPEQWSKFKKENGLDYSGQMNCDDICKFKKIVGDDEYHFADYVVNPELIVIDEDKISKARKCEYYVYTTIDGEINYIADWNEKGDPVFTQKKEYAHIFSNPEDAYDEIEALDSPVREYANPEELLHVEEHKLSAIEWKDIRSLLNYELGIDSDLIDTEYERALRHNPDDKSEKLLDTKKSAVTELLFLTFGSDQDIFHGYNFTNKNIKFSSIEKTLRESVSKVAKEIVTGNLTDVIDIKRDIKKQLWKDEEFQKAIVNDIEINNYIEKRCNESLIAVTNRILSGETAKRIIENANSSEEFELDFDDAVALKKALVSANKARIAVKCIPEAPEMCEFENVVEAIETKVESRKLKISERAAEITERAKLVFSVNYLPDVFVTSITANKLPKITNIAIP